VAAFFKKAVGLLATFYELVRFEHTVFALPFAYLGVFLAARGMPSAGTVLWVTVAMAGARTAAMALNRLIDRHIDAKNPRTQARLLPRGAVSVTAVWGLALGSSAVFMFAAAQLNPLAVRLLPLALIILTVYPYTKRYTWLSHFVLGLALACAPAGGWVAVTGQLGWEAILLASFVTLWVAGFDVIYAIQDIDFDRGQGLHSVPARLGIAGGLGVARALHALSVVLLFATWWFLGLGPAFLVGVLVVAGLLFYEHLLVSPEDLSRLGVAFFNVNGAVSILILFFALADLWLFR